LKGIEILLLMAGLPPLMAQSPTPRLPQRDVAVVLDVSGEWFLEGEPTPLRIGRALPARGVVCSGTSCQPPRTARAGKIIVQHYGRPRPESAWASPGRYPLPDASGVPSGLLDRFHRVLSRIFGQNPDSYAPIISDIGPLFFVSPAVVQTHTDNTPPKAGVYYFNVYQQRHNLFTTHAINPPKEATLWGENASAIFGPPASSAGSLPKLWSTWGISPSGVELRDAVISARDGWADLAPIVGQKPPVTTVAFRWIAGTRQGAPSERPEALFSWSDAGKSGTFFVSLPPGLYRATCFDLAVNQPVGRDGWVLIVPPAAYEFVRLAYEDAVQSTAGWPKEMDRRAAQRYLRAFLRFLADPQVN